MATPIYKGRGQASSDSGGWLGVLFGGTPTYGGAGQPGQKSSVIGGAQPAYKPAPATGASGVSGDVDADACGPGSFAIVIPRQVIEQQ
jgi:hypothetical protein